MISLYTELTPLVKLAHKTVTDYVIRAKTAATGFRNASETLTNSLLIAMVLKGTESSLLRERQQTFREFKVALRSFKDIEQPNRATGNHPVMKTEHKQESRWHVACFQFGQPGHIACFCYSKDNRKNGRGHWCNTCHNSSKGKISLTK